MYDMIGRLMCIETATHSVYDIGLCDTTCSATERRWQYHGYIPTILQLPLRNKVHASKRYINRSS